MSRKTAVAARAISTILILLILLSAVGFIAKFTGGFTGEFKTFYVTFGDEMILNDRENFELGTEREYAFGVKYTFGKLNRNQKLGYHVQVLPNATEETEFTFSDAEGQEHKYSEVKDLAKGFEIEKSENGFTMLAQADLPEILSGDYGENLSGVPQAINSDKAYFALVVSSQNQASKIKITFTLARSGITLNPEKVVF